MDGTTLQTADIIQFPYWKCRRSKAKKGQPDMWDKFKAWAAEPFKADMSALQWFLFVGLLIVIVAGWRVILSHLKTVA